MAQGSIEWKQLKLRTIYVSGTTVQSICNEHPFRNADDVFNDLIGARPHFQGNSFSQMGQQMESVIVKLYEEKTGNMVETDLPIHTMPGWANVGVSPDGIVRCPVSNAMPLPIEIKYAPMRIMKRGEVPAYYSGQLQLTMAIFDLPMMHFVQMGLDEEIDIIPIFRVDGWFEKRKSRIQTFIDRVEKYRQTNPQWEDMYLKWDQ